MSNYKMFRNHELIGEWSKNTTIPKTEGDYLVLYQSDGTEIKRYHQDEYDGFGLNLACGSRKDNPQCPTCHYQEKIAETC